MNSKQKRGKGLKRLQSVCRSDAADVELSAPGWFGIAITPRQKQVRLKVCPILLKRTALGNNIYIIDDFFLSLESQSWIDFGEATGFEQISQEADGEFAHRKNGRIQIDNDIVADSIFKRLVPLLPPSMDGRAVHSCSGNIRIYKYTEGQRFGKHVDESCYDARSGGETKFTVLIYLSGHVPCSSSGDKDVDDGESVVLGGETMFYQGHRDGRLMHSISPSTGRLLLHAQGSRCLTHEGAEVLAGVKYVLRTDVIYL